MRWAGLAGGLWTEWRLGRRIRPMEGFAWGANDLSFIRADGRTLPVPAHRPIKPVYVKRFVALVKGG